MTTPRVGNGRLIANVIACKARGRRLCSRRLSSKTIRIVELRDRRRSTSRQRRLYCKRGGLRRELAGSWRDSAEQYSLHISFVRLRDWQSRFGKATLSIKFVDWSGDADSASDDEAQVTDVLLCTTEKVR